MVLGGAGMQPQPGLTSNVPPPPGPPGMAPPPPSGATPITPHDRATRNPCQCCRACRRCSAGPACPGRSWVRSLLYQERCPASPPAPTTHQRADAGIPGAVALRARETAGRGLGQAAARSWCLAVLGAVTLAAHTGGAGQLAGCAQSLATSEARCRRRSWRSRQVSLGVLGREVRPRKRRKRVSRAVPHRLADHRRRRPTRFAWTVGPLRPYARV